MNSPVVLYYLYHLTDAVAVAVDVAPVAAAVDAPAGDGYLVSSVNRISNVKKKKKMVCYLA